MCGERPLLLFYAPMRPPKTFRGSRQRLRRIRLRGNGSLELWLLILWVAFVLLVVVPWMLRQSH
jgi:hypothetical protein